MAWPWNKNNESAGVQAVPIDSLLPTANVNPEKVAHFKNRGEGYDQPVEYVMGSNGEKLIQDGNHRVWAARERGDQTIKAKESELPEGIKQRWLNNRGY